MNDMLKELKVLLNKKVLAISHDAIYFEDGISLSFNQYETYVEKYNKEKVNMKEIKYYNSNFLEN